MKYAIADNAIVRVDGVTEVMGESPSAVEIDQDAMKRAGISATTITTLPDSKIPTGVIFDFSKTNIGYDKIAVFGSFHFSDQSYNMDLTSPTHRFNMCLLRAISPKQPAFASQGPSPSQNSGAQTAPQSGSDRPAANFVRGIAKAYSGGVLYVSDFGVTREIRVKHKLSEKDALCEFAKFKGKLVKVNLIDQAAEGFESIEYKK